MFFLLTINNVAAKEKLTKKTAVTTLASAFTVHVYTPGNLDFYITSGGGDLNTITNLTVTGNINASDFRIMRDYMPTLAVVNLSGVTIDAYVGNQGTVQLGIPVTYPANEIPIKAFLGKSSLTSLILPPTITSIDDSAMKNCIGLTTITIPESVTTIKMAAFMDCSGLTCK